MPAARVLSYEAFPVIGDLEDKPGIFDAEIDRNAGAMGVARDVVDRLLEDEKNAAAHIDAEPDTLVAFWRGEVQLHTRQGENILSVATHPANKIEQRIVLRVDSPHYVAHCCD